MKRAIAMMLAVMMCLALTSCGKSEAVKNVEAEISAIGTVSVDSKGAIDRAEADYLALEEKDQKQVSNAASIEEAKAAYEACVLEEVQAKIDAIEGDPTNADVIAAARAAYDELDAATQMKVANAAKLMEAEASLPCSQTKYATIDGVYMDTSYVDSKNASNKLLYVFFTASTPDTNLKVACSNVNTVTFGDTNTYQADHYGGSCKYMPNYYYRDYIKDVNVGDSQKVVLTFKIPEGELASEKNIAFNIYGIPDCDKLRVSTKDVVVMNSADEIAKDIDSDGYNKGVKAFSPADAATAAKVHEEIDGYYWTFYVNNTTYEVEFFSNNTYELRTKFGTTGGDYTILNEYIQLVNGATGAVNNIPFTVKGNSVDIDPATGFDVREG